MPEGFEYRLPLGATAADFVELVLEPGGIVIGYIAIEEALEKAGQQPAAFLGEEAVLLDPDIGAVFQRLDNRGIGRGSPDAQFFHLLDQTGFAVARRGLGEMLGCIDGLLGRAVTLGHGRQQTAILVLVIIATFFVERQKSGEFDNLSIGSQTGLAGTVQHFHGCPLETGGGHLAGHRALQDEIIEFCMIAAADGTFGETGRTDRFMRFLGIFGLALVYPGAVGNIARVIAVSDCLARGGNGTAVHLNAIGPHIGDRAIFIKLLGYTHGVAGGIAELARGFLLQGRSREWRWRVAGKRLGFDRFNREQTIFDGGPGPHCLLFIGEIHLAQFLAVMDGQPRFEGLPALLHLGGNRPIFLWPERFDFTFPLDDQPERNRLDPAGRFCTRKLAPEHGRQCESDQIVERPAGAIGIDKILIERTGMSHGFRHRSLGDRIEGHPIHDIRQRFLGAQHFLHVPADCFAFAVRVGRENQASGFFRFVGDRFQLLGLVGIILPGHGETIVRINRTVLGRKVANMAVGCQDLEIRSQIFFNGFGLCGRLDDD